MTAKGLITNIQRCSTEDGPGIRTTAFLKGCPLRCVWCHNIETINADPIIIWHSTRCIGDQACVRSCPENALELTKDGMKVDRIRCKVCGTCVEVCPTTAMELMGQEWAAEDLVEELARDAIFFETSNGGVTLSGGEPLYQPDFVIEVAEGLKKLGIHVALDTCGYYSELVLRRALPHFDLVLYDLKIMDSALHEKHTGVPNERILENAKVIAESGIPMWIRTPIIPDHTDNIDNIRAIAEFIVSSLPNVERYDLLAFNNMCIDKYTLFDTTYLLKDAPLISREVMEHLSLIARDAGVKNVHWSGMTQRDDNEQSSPKMEVTKCG